MIKKTKHRFWWVSNAQQALWKSISFASEIFTMRLFGSCLIQFADCVINEEDVSEKAIL